MKEPYKDHSVVRDTPRIASVNREVAQEPSLGAVQLALLTRCAVQTKTCQYTGVCRPLAPAFLIPLVPANTCSGMAWIELFFRFLIFKCSCASGMLFHSSSET